MLPPLLMICVLYEMAFKSGQGHMELEYSTRYSPFHVALVRLIWLGLVTGVILMAACVPMKMLWKLSFGAALLYTWTPFLIMSMITFLIMEHIRGRQGVYTAIGMYMIAAAFVLTDIEKCLRAYDRELLGFWIIVFTAAVIGNVFQLRRLIKKMRSYELTC